MIIYKLTNKVNGKLYIGQTIRDLDERLYWHFYSAKTGPTSYIHRAIRKYGIQSFECSVIDSTDTKETLDEKEVYWIKFLKTKAPDGYNMTDGGSGGSTNKGKPHSKETIRKMSDQKKGDNNPFFGKRHSEETKRKMSNAQKGNKHLLGHKHSEETRKKMHLAAQARLHPEKENDHGRAN